MGAKVCVEKVDVLLWPLYTYIYIYISPSNEYMTSIRLKDFESHLVVT